MAQSTLSKPAKAAQAYLKTLGHDVPLTQCYELLARAGGFRNRHEAEAAEKRTALAKETGFGSDLEIDGTRDLKLVGGDGVWINVDFADIKISRVRPEEVHVALYPVGDVDGPVVSEARIGIDDAKADDEPVIPAEIHADDYAAEATFDSHAYFQAATDEEIEKIIAVGYTGDYSTDAVGRFFLGRNAHVTEVFDYVRAAPGRGTRKNQVGFEVSIDEWRLNQWIARERPALFNRLVAKGAIEIGEHWFSAFKSHPMASSGRESSAAGMNSGEVVRVMSTGEAVRVDEFAPGGEAYVTKADGTHAMVNVNELESVVAPSSAPKP